MNAELLPGLQSVLPERVELLGEPPPLVGIGGGSERAAGDVETKEREVDLFARATERLGHLTDDLLLERLLRSRDVVTRAQSIEVWTLEAAVA